MKDSQPAAPSATSPSKYIKANNERFSTFTLISAYTDISISRRIMKDSQPPITPMMKHGKYIKANNERFSTSDSTDAPSP